MANHAQMARPKPKPPRRRKIWRAQIRYMLLNDFEKRPDLKLLYAFHYYRGGKDKSPIGVTIGYTEQGILWVANGDVPPPSRRYRKVNVIDLKKSPAP